MRRPEIYLDLNRIGTLEYFTNVNPIFDLTYNINAREIKEKILRSKRIKDTKKLHYAEE